MYVEIRHKQLTQCNSCQGSADQYHWKGIYSHKHKLSCIWVAIVISSASINLHMTICSYEGGGLLVLQNTHTHLSHTFTFRITNEGGAGDLGMGVS